MKDYNCPVCNKTGLPDYRNQHTICPQCNTDLKSYLILHSRLKTKPLRILISLLCLLLILFCIVIYQKLHFAKENQAVKAENLKNLVSLQDSVVVLKNEIDNLKNGVPGEIDGSKEATIEYIVKEGDCLSSISELFYGDWRNYQRIGTDNNLSEPYLLAVGLTLKIKIKVK